MELGREPIEPPPTRWRLPLPELADENGLCGIGADLAPGTLLAAYRAGLFPMPLRKKTLGWWSPDPRGVIPLDGLKVSRSLRRSCQRYEIRTNLRFREVMEQCGDPDRPHAWITPHVIDAYDTLHHLGWAHSFETYAGEELVGGLYGVRIGGLFAGESMFSRATDASKVALVHLVEWLLASGASLLDVQWTTPHLVSVGAVDVPRSEYLRMLAEAVDGP